LGEVHPDVADAFEFSARAYVAELDLALVMQRMRPMGDVKPQPRYPAVTRDIALVMPETQQVGPVLTAMREAGGKLLERAEMFDVYRSQQLGLDRKSVAFTCTFRAEDRTLTDAEITAAMEKLLKVCQERFGAMLRA